MSDTIISVENLGKRYRISHQQTTRRYKTVREVVTEKVKAPFDKLFGRQGNLAVAGSHAPDKSPTTEDFWALKDVSFDIKQGDVVGIIGRNGAGKSTLLKILSRITEPTVGQITLKGRVASLLEVGTGFHPELTGRENIFLNGAILGMSKVEIKRKFDEIVAFAEVEKFLDTPVKRYSSGMYVRLAFAVAAHLEPEILIVDEVLAVGDAAFQKKCLGKIGDVARHGRTVLFVSHTMSAVKSLTTRAILMDKGRVVSNGKTDEVLNKYLEMSSDASSDSPVVKSKGRHTTIKRVQLLDAENRPANFYISGTALSLEIQFTTDGTPHMSLELFLTDSNQNRLGFTSLYQLNGVSLPEAPGVYVCKLKLKPLWLASGNYQLDVATSVVNTCWDLEIDRVLVFEVPYSSPNGTDWDFKASHGLGAFAWLAEETPEVILSSNEKPEPQAATIGY